MSNTLSTVEEAIAHINKNYGTGSIVRLGDHKISPTPVTSTGILPLDLALGVGGLPRGKIIEAYGPESSGKSTLALHFIAEAQRSGQACVYIDAENTFDDVYAVALGVDRDSLLLSMPDSMEDALSILIDLVKTGLFGLIVVDSVAALVPRAELEGEMGDANVGLRARLMGQAIRKATRDANANKTTLFFINQLRSKVGVIYGSPETTPGGRALAYAASVRLDIRRIETIKGKDKQAVANRTRVKVVKNKVGIPYRQAEFDIEFGVGVPKEGALLDCAVDFGFIKKAGSWYTYEGEQIGQGRERASNWLVEHPDVYEEIHSLILNQSVVGQVPNAIGLIKEEDE